MLLRNEMFVRNNRAVLNSYAKINLTLDVLGKRDDGYHEVSMIMQTLSLSDTVTVDRTKAGIDVSTNASYIPGNSKNIAYKAAAAFFRNTGLDGGVKIRIKKNIPVAAGLAGGSGNAAAVLCALDVLYGTELGTDRLCGIGKELGADVPYCFDGGTCLAEGIGERLTKLPPMPVIPVLLVKPPISVSTAAIYEKIDSAEVKTGPDTKAVAEAIKNGNIGAVASGLCNVMEAVTEKEYPVIADIKRKMIECGAMGAGMSGSGPTVFGLFDDYGTAKRAADVFSQDFGEVYVTTIKNSYSQST